MPKPSQAPEPVNILDDDNEQTPETQAMDTSV